VSAPRTDHYSYSVYADAAMAESFDGLRFSGPIGRYIAESQERLIATFLAPAEGRTVLDVGTGTGRAAIALARRGAIVTGVDASNEMLAVARARAADARVDVSFIAGDAHGLAFDDRSFDVARNRVVFDYPALASAAAIQSWSRRVAAAAGARVEAYRVFSDRSIQATLGAHGFRAVDSDRQFVLPIALHKAIGSLAMTSRVEGALARVGLRSILGSPVTVVAERCAS
jgi:SAM-dependent methyltransferase